MDSHSTLEDKSLIDQMRSGDYAAFTLLYNKYIRQLTQYGLKFLPDLPAVEDCLHDVFVWVWTNRQKLDNRCKPATSMPIHSNYNSHRKRLCCIMRTGG